MKTTIIINTQRAFTLSELLAVILILSLLAGMLLPALAYAKKKSRALVCKNHLSQLGKALALYEGDEGAYPGTGGGLLVVNGTFRENPASWESRLRPFAGTNKQVFICPANQPVHWGDFHAPCFGYNEFGSGKAGSGEHLGLGTGQDDRPPAYIKADQVKAPSNMIILGEIQLHPSVWANIISPNRAFAMASLDTIVAGRHQGKSAMLFCDGHIESARQLAWIEASNHRRSRWNIDHQPHPDTW